MSEVLNKSIVLSLNKAWQPIGVITVAEAITKLTGSGQAGGAPALAMEMVKTPEGELVPSYPITWDAWIKLPVRPDDMTITTSQGSVRVPTVIVQQKFDKVPQKRQKWSRRAVWERDGGICQATGEKVTKETADIDHIHAQSRGGKNTFENTVVMKKGLNRAKGSKSLKEAGIKLLRKPKAPAPMPVSCTIREAKHPSWKPFLVTK